MSLVTLIGVGLMANAEAYVARTLRVTLQVNTKHPVGANIAYFEEQVEKSSNGQFKIELYDWAQLYKGNEVPEAVASGAVDMGAD